MNPAISVILLTTLIGAAQGLLVALYGAEVATALSAAVTPASDLFYVAGGALTVVLATGGLLASFFHLGRPERAWRSAAMWRTSWLSREVIVLPAFIAAVAAYGLAHYLHLRGTLMLGGVALALCVALFVCTAMIYACIKFLQEWSSPLTVANYFLLGLASGFTLAAAFSVFAAPQLAIGYGAIAAWLTLAGLLTRALSLRRNARLRPKSTVQSATGLRHPKVVQKSQGFTGGSFNTREFFHGKSRMFLRNVKWIFLLLAFVLPIIVLWVAVWTAAPVLLVPAFILQYTGLLFERWFFFAQANHPQNLYYQAIS